MTPNLILIIMNSYIYYKVRQIQIKFMIKEYKKIIIKN